MSAKVQSGKPPRRSGKRRRLALPMLILAASAVFGQVAEPPRESKEETVAKGLADFASPAPEIRRRAVLLLSKYDDPQAQAALVRALHDPESEIRQAAVVAVVENQLFAQAGSQLLLMLRDPNVHIRRTVSTFLRAILFSPGHFNALTGSHRFSPAELAALQSAMTDEDATVRKNLLKHAALLRQAVRVELLLPMLKDPDAEIRMLALDQVAQILAANPARLAQELAPLARDPEPALRLQLAELLGRTAHAAPANLLRQLTGDENFEVAIEARLSLLTQEDASQWPPLRQALDDHRMTGKTAERIIRSLFRLPDRGTAALIELVKHEKPLYRITALRTYGAFNRHALDLALLWGCLEDSFSPVRQEAATLILAYPSRNRAADFPADRLAGLVDSPFVDVRGLAVTLAALADRDTSLKLLMDLVLDEHTGIRANAIEHLIAKRLGDWQEVAKVSAADENREIRERTVKALLAAPVGPNLQVLEAIKATTRDRELYKLIVDALAKPAP